MKENIDGTKRLIIEGKKSRRSRRNGNRIIMSGLNVFWEGEEEKVAMECYEPWLEGNSKSEKATLLW